jgi:hypothetical protein
MNYVLVLLLEVRPQRLGVEGTRQAERPRERPTALGEIEATGNGMQRCTSSRQPTLGIGDHTILDHHGSQQLGTRRSTPTSHTGAYRSRATDHREVYLLAHPTGFAGATAGSRAPGACCDATGVSGRISIRQPVRRAARRAFCPSLPIASDNW